jgi:hypothetical protein
MTKGKRKGPEKSELALHHEFSVQCSFGVSINGCHFPFLIILLRSGGQRFSKINRLKQIKLLIFSD